MTGLTWAFGVLNGRDGETKAGAGRTLFLSQTWLWKAVLFTRNKEGRRGSRPEPGLGREAQPRLGRAVGSVPCGFLPRLRLRLAGWVPVRLVPCASVCKAPGCLRFEHRDVLV